MLTDCAVGIKIKNDKSGEMQKMGRLHSMVEEETDRLSVMRAADSLSQCTRDINGVQLGADLLLVLMGDGVGDNNLGENAVVDDLNSLAAKNAVRDNGVDFDSSVLGKSLGGQAKGSAGISHIVHQNGNLSLHISDKNHPRDLVGLLALLVNQRKVQVQTIGNRGGSVIVE